MEVYRTFVFGVFDVQKMYQFLYWCFVPALTDTMPGCLNILQPPMDGRLCYAV